MTIDPRGRLGRELEVAEPVALDLRQLDEPAGNEIAQRMEQDGLSREEAILQMLAELATLKATEGQDGESASVASNVRTQDPDIIRLRISRLFENDGVQQATDKIRTEGSAAGRMTVGGAITRLVVFGARAYNSRQDTPKRPARTPRKSFDPFSDLDELLRGFKI